MTVDLGRKGEEMEVFIASAAILLSVRCEKLDNGNGRYLYGILQAPQSPSGRDPASHQSW